MMAPRFLIAAVRPFSSPFTASARRTFTTTQRLLIKEDADRSPEHVEKAKQDQLKEQKQGQGKWREDLASAGESNIAADKDNVNDHQSHMKDLQQETANKGEKGDI